MEYVQMPDWERIERLNAGQRLVKDSLTMLSMGPVRETPAVIEGKVVPRKSAYICLAVDHRVLDGIIPMKFAHEVIHLLENPRLLVKD